MSETVQRTHSEWLNGKPFIVVEETRQGFLRVKKWFGCKLCGHEFHAGDPARWIYANGTPGMGTGNFFICSACDQGNEAVLALAKQQFELAKSLAKRWGIYGPDWERELLRSL